MVICIKKLLYIKMLFSLSLILVLVSYILNWEVSLLNIFIYHLGGKTLPHSLNDHTQISQSINWHYGSKQLCKIQSCQNQRQMNMSLDMSSSASSETATKHAVTCLSLPRVVACSPSSLHRLGAWDSRAVSSQQIRLANAHPSLTILEPTPTEKAGAGENPWASTSGINGWYVLLPEGVKKLRHLKWIFPWRQLWSVSWSAKHP